MKTILVSYDLKSKDRNYSSLIETIKAAEGWWHHLDSTWVIVTNESLSVWQEKLMAQMDKSDNLFLIEIQSGVVNGWLPSQAWEWLRKHTTLRQ